jgi:fatty acid desaturase
MGSVALSAPKGKSLKDADFKEQLQGLRQTDNLTNWLYVVRTYLYFALVIGAAVGFDFYRGQAGWSFWWNIPVALVTIILVGAGQHQLSGLAHEGSHHILFKNRLLNDLASDLLCMFPLFSSTHHYRLQHHAHHQFVNDPLRDPDVSQLQTSGHWLPFPMGKRQFLLTLLRQVLWPLNLVRFMRIRAAYNATGTDKNPYMPKGVKLSKLSVRVGIAYLLCQVLALTGLTWYALTYHDALWLAVAPAALWLAVTVFYAVLPERLFHQSRIRPVVSQRISSILRVTYATAVFNALAWLSLYTVPWAAVYYVVYWLVPIFTSFSFFMILRQLVQHGNADRGWLTNTRVFFVSHFIRFSVFPIGQDYHLPHHLFASVPHYRLKRLHELLLEYPEYREQAVLVHGYFAPPHRPPTHPTVLDVLGPEYAAKDFRGVHIDNSVLEDDEVEEKAEILREGEREARRLAEQAGVQQQGG